MKDVLIDLENPGKLSDFLIKNGVVTREDDFAIDYCDGGVSSKTAIVKVENRWYFAKQAREKLLVEEEWIADVDRIAIETEGNRVFHRIMPDVVPKVLLYDQENKIMVREAVSDEFVMWKNDLLNGVLDFKIADMVVRTLANFHNHTATDSSIAETFSNRRILHQLRISPYFEFLISRHPYIGSEIKALIEQSLSRKHALVHGDYSPKNILTKEEAICVLDFEIAHFGDVSLDLSFLLSHITLKAFYHTAWFDAFLCMARFMADTYFHHIHFESRANLESHAVKMYGLFLLARVDGKSTVEYLNDEAAKQEVRESAIRLIKSPVSILFDEAFELVRQHGLKLNASELNRIEGVI